MSSGAQVPLWIPLLVAGIGLLGVLVTQALGIWQEKQRADRQAREAADERAHEHKVWLRQQRLALYGEFTTLAARGDRTIRSVNIHSFKPKNVDASSDTLNKTRDTLGTFEEATGKIQIVGSYKVATLALQVEQAIRKSYTFLMEAIVETFTVEEWEAKHSALIDEYASAHERLLEAMREELGTPAAG